MRCNYLQFTSTLPSKAIMFISHVVPQVHYSIPRVIGKKRIHPSWLPVLKFPSLLHIKMRATHQTHWLNAPCSVWNSLSKLSWLTKGPWSVYVHGGVSAGPDSHGAHGGDPTGWSMHSQCPCKCTGSASHQPFIIPKPSFWMHCVVH